MALLCHATQLERKEDSVRVEDRIPFLHVVLSALVASSAVVAQTTPPADQTHPPTVNEKVVVSATRGNELETEIPGQATVIRGEDLRRENVHTLADALQDMVGLDSGMGSDNGNRLPNVGVWGLKEFDALLFMVDGVPIGGPFDPSLTQVNIDDVDHIEIVKGPQGTLYGVSAFAGMVQVFTKEGATGTHVSLAGGSFSDGRASFSTAFQMGDARLRAFGNIQRSNGWQDLTHYSDDRFGLRLDSPLAGGTLAATFGVYHNTQHFGSPLPVDPPSGETLPGFQIDRNYEVGGARLDHRLYSLTTNYSRPLASNVTLVNTLAVALDDQTSIQSFISATDGNTATADGVALYPRETTFYESLYLTASGNGFDLSLQIDPVVVPDFSVANLTDSRSFDDRRTFVGFYINDEWTPVKYLTVTAGARFDSVSETVHAQIQEAGAAAPTYSNDSKSDGQWSGGVAVLARLIDDRGGTLNGINLYAAAKSAFKPAAPNVTNATSVQILDPERTRSGEVGVKTRWLEHQLSFDVSLFHLSFENTVTSVLGPDGNPMLVNAGEERFQGAEMELGFHPARLKDLSVTAGYAHHDATYVQFSFIDPVAGPQSADGQRLELVPRDLWNFKMAYHPANGLGGWVAARHQNERPFDKINIAVMPSFYEWDAGVSYGLLFARLSVVGRNLGDSRHFVAESEIGDAQNYVAAPRRFLAELTLNF